MKRFFEKQDYGVSIARLWLMRVVYLIIAVLFGVPTWMTIIEDWGTFEPLEGVAYAFWASLCVLALIGVRYPLKMLPILLIQALYKFVWLLAVGYPLLDAGLMLDDHSTSLMRAMRRGVVIDVIAIPWLFVYREYLASFFRRSGP